MRESCKPWRTSEGKCDYCGSPATYSYGGPLIGHKMGPIEHVCDHHYSRAFRRYENEYGHPCSIWSVWLGACNYHWWRRYQRWLVYNMKRRGLS